MDWTFLKTHKPFWALIVASIAIFPSLFMGPQILGFVLLVYVLVIGWVTVSLLGPNIIKQVNQSAEEHATQAADEQQYGRASVYLSVIPMIPIGLIFVGFIIFHLIF